jgi:hypothetical protein
MPRFVVLLHEMPPGYPRPNHYDLMLEQGTALATWALAELPSAGGDSVAAERLPDHRLDYLDYEGEVSGGRGRVVRVDRGNYEPLPADSGGQHLYRLAGERLCGLLYIQPPAGSASVWRIRLRRE